MTIPDRCEIEYDLEVGDLVTPRFEPFKAMGIVTKVEKLKPPQPPSTSKVYVCWYLSALSNRDTYSHEEFVVALYKISQ